MPTSIDKSAGQSLLTNLVGLAVDTYRISVGVGRSEEKEARIIGPPAYSLSNPAISPTTETVRIGSATTYTHVSDCIRPEPLSMSPDGEPNQSAASPPGPIKAKRRF